VNIIILAAGKGTRMQSDLPKVLMPLAGRPLVVHVLETLKHFKNTRTILIVGYEQQKVREATKNYALSYAEQLEQHGTGHAVQMAVPYLDSQQTDTLILCGDVPLIKAETLEQLLKEHQSSHAQATILTTQLPDAGSYGRIVRSPDRSVQKIVEFKDASPQEREIKEINSGIYVYDTKLLIKALKELKPANAQKEYYLTDCIEILKKAGHKIAAFCTLDPKEVAGVNTLTELAELEKVFVQN